MTTAEEHTTKQQIDRVHKVRRDKEERIRRRTEAIQSKQTGLK